MSARRRLRGLVRKEWLQIWRDPSSLAIAFVLPACLLLLFGYGVTLDAEHAPLALVVEAPSAETAGFTALFAESRYFSPRRGLDMPAAMAALAAHDVDGILRLRADFAPALARGEPPPVQLVLNGVDANTANLLNGYVQGVWALWRERQSRPGGPLPAAPLQLDTRIWYNAEVSSRNYIVPGLIAVIMTLIGALLTALVMAREWERGTMEALMVTPVTVHELLLGKLLPYFLLGMAGMALSVAMALLLFHVPLRGSPWVLLLASALFLLAALGMGLLISVTARAQFVAGLAAIIATFLPAFMLSGFIFDIGSMPAPVQWLTHVVAARYFVRILQTVFLAGNVWQVILPNAAALAVLAGVFLTAAWRRLDKRLD